MHIKCPNCKRCLRVAESPRSQVVGCPACKKRLKVPASRASQSPPGSGGSTTVTPPGALVSPAHILSAAASGWFYAQGKQRLGPFSLEHLRHLAAAEQLQPSDMVLPAGSRKWVEARAVEGLFITRPAARADVAKAKVFLSYGRRDAKGLADRLRADLETRGYEVWQDVREIRSGTSWAQEIEDGLRSAQLVIALLSPHAVRRQGSANNSDNLDSICLDEIAFARSHSKPIVPVMVKQCEPPLFIYRLDYVNLCAWNDSDDQYRAGLERLLDGIQAGLQGKVSYRTWVDRLRPWDFAAFLAEKRQNFCGREWLFDEIDAWRASSKERALLITGDPGTGKSAIVAELVHRNPGGQVLAYHCCQADTQETLQSGRFVRSLAAMIASKLDAYAERLADPDLEEALSEQKCSSDPASAFEAGILTPLQTLPAPPEGVRYLLIDALDEALALGGGDSFTIVDLLATRLGRLPPWLRIVATTRKERAVVDRLRGLRAQELDAQDARNLEDVGQYAAARLQTPNLVERLAASRLHASAVERALRDKSAGNFLYVVQALDGIERDQFSLANLDALPPGLYGLYHSFFRRLFPNEKSFEPVKGVLQVVVAAYAPLDENQLARATGLDAKEQLAAILRRLAVYLPARDGKYAVYHKSLADWLTAPDFRGDLHSVSSKSGHQLLAEACWQEYVKCAHMMSLYALKYLPKHLCASGQWDRLWQLLTDLAFLETKVEKDLVFDLASDFTEAVHSLPQARPHRRILCLLEEALRRDLHFIARHAHDYPQALFQCLWNTCWWYDCPQGREHYDNNEDVVWNRDGEWLHTLLERWRLETEAKQPGFIWLRSVRPPFVELGTALYAVLAGHTGPVNSISLGPDGKILASGSDDKTIKLWDLASCQETASVGGHQDHVECVAFSPDGKILASGSKDTTIKLWDMANWSERTTLHGHTSCVWSVIFSPDGKTLASGSDDTTIKLWDVAEGQERTTLCGHKHSVYSLSFSPDGRVLASGGGYDDRILLWDALTGDRMGALSHGCAVLSLAFSPDGTILASGGGNRTNTHQDYFIKLWDLAQHREIATLSGQWEAVYSVAFSTNGEIIAGGARGDIRLWQVKAVLQGETKAIFEVSKYGFSVSSVIFSLDGETLASGSWDHTIKLWDLNKGGQRRRILHGHSNDIRGLRFGPDGRMVATASKEAGYGFLVKEWDLVSGSCRDTYEMQASLNWPSSCETSLRTVSSRDNQSVVESMNGQSIAFYSIPLERATVDASGRIFAGRGNPARHVHIVVLEGELEGESR